MHYIPRNVSVRQYQVMLCLETICIAFYSDARLHLIFFRPFQMSDAFHKFSLFPPLFNAPV